MNTQTKQTGGPTKWDMRDYRTRCRNTVKKSIHTATANLEVLKSQTIAPANGLSQADMISILSDTIAEWNDNKETWVKNAKKSLKTKQS